MPKKMVLNLYNLNEVDFSLNPESEKDPEKEEKRKKIKR